MMIVTTLSGLSSISLRSAMSKCFSLSSSSIFSRSSPASLLRRISRIASACIFEKSNCAISASRASSRVRLARMVLITSFIWSSAFFSHSSICARASATFSSYIVRRVTTSFLCLIKFSSNSLRLKSLGCFPLSPSPIVLKLKLVCSGVSL